MKLNIKGQLAIMIIIALVIVAGVALFFVVKSQAGVENVPTELAPIYSFYSTCIEQETRAAIDLAGSQGGRIYPGEYEPGSEHAPFSNQLNFLGFPVPYWYYITGNGIARENVPTKSEIELDMEKFIAGRIQECDFEAFYAQGTDITYDTPSVNVVINEQSVEVEVEGSLRANKEEVSAVKNKHEVIVQSKFGKFYSQALEIYNKQKSETVLENYVIDTLRLNAPVDGVEISCSPKIWKAAEVKDELQTALENNIQKLKFKGSYYSLNDKTDEYYVIDQEVDESVNILYSKNWPSRIEISGGDDELLIAKPVGTQEGLGIMGFCYAPYHFVYDVSFPVLIQIYNNEEIFQFPVVSVVDNNVAREAVYSQIVEEEEVDLCRYKNKPIEVNVFNSNLEKIDANVSYNCFNEVCQLGTTQNGKFTGNAPACVNGYLEVSAGGYASEKQLFSSNDETSADIVLDKEYAIDVELRVSNQKLNGNAIVTFSGKRSKTIAMPQQESVELSEGYYNISVYVYGNASITIPESRKEQCTQVSSSGIAGLFGSTKTECFEIVIPATKIDYALTAGGKTSEYLLKDVLENGKIILNVDELDKPDSLAKLQNNFAAFESNGVEVTYA